MKKILLIILSIILVVIVVGIYKFNFTNNDIYITDENNDVIPYEEQGEGLLKKDDSYFLSIYNQETEKGVSYSEVDIVTRGDINSDGLEDAIVSVFTCGASCGLNYNFLLQNNNSEPTFLKTGERYNSLYVGSSALRTNITDIKIENGEVIMTGYAWGADWGEREKNRDKLETYEFSIINGVLN